MQTEIRDLLKKNQLSITESRQRILGLFLKSDGALSHADIEKRIADGIDRVTIYRTLQIFEEKGIIHNIPSSDILYVTAAIKLFAWKMYTCLKLSCRKVFLQENQIWL
jgi:Fur family ferric uptake transcriptional regulator